MSVVLHPVQINRGGYTAMLRQEVTLRAYEVYCHLYGEQAALVTGHCRGGFSAGELISLLYAHSFPKNEWRQRADEAMMGMRGL